ncbi:hypothetical protein N0B30_22675 (plasmid) [Bacillus subtilis]|nr:DnaA N-terminal domain-containing protein [Bacillus subtilis]MCB4338733.1 hypothetical protein [Bacillus subtilis]MCT6515437.1 hypothetical protein [Bacillus subtilis]MEC0407578.1 DnaA N-terminal domain-containing protein [Bacillus subtilis]MEC0419543.1 DnaA N-terminal domain-containing protein [Bacillus subtilis]MEC0449036.1 DnaA N-terminal domain-containing protein [Bacillus subtilis]
MTSENDRIENKRFYGVNERIEKKEYTNINEYPEHFTDRAKRWEALIQLGICDYGLAIWEVLAYLDIHWNSEYQFDVYYERDYEPKVRADFEKLAASRMTKGEGNVITDQAAENQKNQKTSTDAMTRLELSKQKVNLTYHEFMANQLSKPAYKTWVKDSILVKKDELSYVVFAPNDAFQYDWLETRYDTLIRECISNNFVNNSDSITLSYQLIE